MSLSYDIKKINEDTWIIEEEGVRFFLLEGTKKALLIDSGMNTHNAKEIAESLTKLPVELINTHADGDHTGSNAEFSAPYMHPAELPNYHKSGACFSEITPVWDGDMLELGQRAIFVITLPGHTPGSIALYDRKYKNLFSGDPIQDGSIFMFGPYRDMVGYRHSLLKLKKSPLQIVNIYPSHGSYPIHMDIVDKLIDASEKIMKGSVPYAEGEMFGKNIRIYDVGTAKFLCDNFI